MKLLIKPEDDFVKGMYENHGHFHEGDVGLDLFIATQQVIPAKSLTNVIDLKIKCEVKDAHGYILAPRSSMAKTALRLSNSIGVIDKGYRGNILALVDNVSDMPITLEIGQRMFQIIGSPLEPIIIKVVEELSETTRGTGGFGSTGGTA